MSACVFMNVFTICVLRKVLFSHCCCPVSIAVLVRMLLGVCECLCSYVYMCVFVCFHYKTSTALFALKVVNRWKTYKIKTKRVSVR